jgi:hypothetical protein
VRGGFRSAAADPDELRRLLGDEARGVIVVLVDEPQARDAIIDAATIPLLLLPVPTPE